MEEEGSGRGIRKEWREGAENLEVSGEETMREVEGRRKLSINSLGF